MNFRIEHASVGDAEEILKLQYLCYQSEAALYNNYAIPPLTQSLPDIRSEFAHSIILACRSDAAIIGSVRAKELDGRCFIARLIVNPDMQRRGIGSRLMNAIEHAFPAVEAYELFTGHRSEGNLRLYRSLGYREFKVEQAGPGLELVFLEKVRSPQIKAV